MSHLIDLTGQRFGMMTVIEKLPPKPKAKHTYWRCRCDCGTERVVTGGSLREGYGRSCGCVRGEKIELQYIKNDPDWKANKKAKKRTACPYNEGVQCYQKDCWRCGWNPKVAEVRNQRLEVGHGN